MGRDEETETGAEADWLGEDMIQRTGDRITVPPEVVEAGVVEPGEPVFWAEASGEVIISKRRAAFGDGERFRLLGETTLQADRETALPAAVAGRDGFEAGDILHFVRGESTGTAPVCRVLPEDASEFPGT